jgi:hypothetical protein
MLDKIREHLREFKGLLDTVECTDGRSVTVDYENSLASACARVQTVASSGGKVMFIGRVCP